METAIDEYWTRSDEIGRLQLPPRDVEYDLSFIWHQSQESYGRNHREIGLGVLKEAGARVYVHAKAVFYTPNIFVTVALTAPGEKTEFGTEIGEVTDSEAKGQVRHEVAGCQAWYYEKERTLMIWEVDLRHDYRSADGPAQDFLLLTIWSGFERRLLEEFPDCERILTPGWDPIYDGDAWRAFLVSSGFLYHIENTFIKEVKGA